MHLWFQMFERFQIIVNISIFFVIISIFLVWTSLTYVPNNQESFIIVVEPSSHDYITFKHQCRTLMARWSYWKIVKLGEIVSICTYLSLLNLFWSDVLLYLRRTLIIQNLCKFKCFYNSSIAFKYISRTLIIQNLCKFKCFYNFKYCIKYFKDIDYSESLQIQMFLQFKYCI